MGIHVPIVLRCLDCGNKNDLEKMNIYHQETNWQDKYTVKITQIINEWMNDKFILLL